MLPHAIASRVFGESHSFEKIHTLSDMVDDAKTYTKYHQNFWGNRVPNPQNSSGACPKHWSAYFVSHEGPKILRRAKRLKIALWAKSTDKYEPPRPTKI